MTIEKVTIKRSGGLFANIKSPAREFAVEQLTADQISALENLKSISAVSDDGVRDGFVYAITISHTNGEPQTHQIQQGRFPEALVLLRKAADVLGPVVGPKAKL